MLISTKMSSARIIPLPGPGPALGCHNQIHLGRTYHRVSLLEQQAHLQPQTLWAMSVPLSLYLWKMRWRSKCLLPGKSMQVCKLLYPSLWSPWVDQVHWRIPALPDLLWAQEPVHTLCLPHRVDSVSFQTLLPVCFSLWSHGVVECLLFLA